MPRGKPKKTGAPRGRGTNSKPKLAKSKSSGAADNPEQIPQELSVEKITVKRNVSGKVEMQVKWEGFPPECNTCVPLEKLADCIPLVAQFESTLSGMLRMANKTDDSSSKSSGTEKKDGEKLTESKASPAPAPGERQLKAGKPTGPWPNVEIETPSSSFNKRKNLTPADGYIFNRPYSPSPLSESSDSDSQPLSMLRISCAAKENMPKVGSPLNPQKKLLPQTKDVTKTSEENPISPTPENPIEKETNDIRNMNFAEHRPEVQTLDQDSKNGKNSMEKDKKGSKEIQTSESSDDDSDIPSMTPYQNVFGLARGLELDKVVHSIRLFDRHFLFVTWKGSKEVDTVPIEDLKETYPAKVLEYFQKMEHRY
ncbi:uncharacterized protein LOC110185692 [Drosophila serrata]|uniref:uncharacterized protein LOC110185692 n=1 Tax=Drosophila serrata TaxID=7274 RepID=UPI000A1D0227|nr:uncharacterized protein LOC110185692 [Drosophila serrata]